LVWSTNNDPDLDNLTYEINITRFVGDGSCGGWNYLNITSIVNVSNHTLNTNEELLCLWDENYRYNWSVRVYDGEFYSNWSENFNISVQGLLEINLINSSVSFGQLIFGDSDNTTDDNPAPFVLENAGNVYINITLNASKLWLTQIEDSSYYQFSAANATSRSGGFNGSKSITVFTAMPILGNLTAVSDFDFHDTSDWAEIELNITVPDGEPPGNRESNIRFTSMRSI